MPDADARPRRLRWSTWALAVLALLVVLGGVWRLGHRAAPPRYTLAQVDRGPVVARITATGILSAVVTVQVGSQVSGRIARLLTDWNGTVTKGQLIAEIDPALFEANVAQAEANVLAADGQLKQAEAKALDAKRQYDRNRPLRAQNLIAQADLDTSETNLRAADAAVVAARGNLAQARAQAVQARVNLAYTEIHSPIDGTVISRSVDVGQTVAASLQAPTLFTIAGDLRQMQVDTSIAEADVGKLAPGMEASFVVDAFPDERFRGVIRQIRNAPQTQQNVVTYDAVIDVRNPDLKLRPGMTANVTVVWAERPDVLRVPNAALRFRPPPELLARLSRPSGASEADGRAPGRRGSSDGPDAGPDTETAALAGAGDGGVGGSPPSLRSGAAARGPDGTTRPGGGGRGGGAGRTVWVLRAGATDPVPVPVRPGVSDGTVTEVLGAGLAAGDAVVVGVESTGRPGPAPLPGVPAGPGGPGRRPF